MPLRAVAGGATRQESVALALAALPDGPRAVVLIHDAVRPVPAGRARCREALAALDAGGAWDGAVLGEPSTDTLKRVDGTGRILGTEPREGIFRAQTPQVARLGPWREAFAWARATGLPGHRRRLPAGGHGPPGEADPVPRLQPEAHHPRGLGPGCLADESKGSRPVGTTGCGRLTYSGTLAWLNKSSYILNDLIEAWILLGSGRGPIMPRTRHAQTLAHPVTLSGNGLHGDPSLHRGACARRNTPPGIVFRHLPSGVEIPARAEFVGDCSLATTLARDGVGCRRWNTCSPPSWAWRSTTSPWN